MSVKKQLFVPMLLLFWLSTAQACSDRRISESGWIPVNDRQLLNDMSFVVGRKLVADVVSEFGEPKFTVERDGRAQMAWVYGEKKTVATTNCGENEVQFFFEAFVLLVEARDEQIGRCRVLRRTIVSANEVVDPMQEADVLPFTVQEKSCRWWLRELRKP